MRKSMRFSMRNSYFKETFTEEDWWPLLDYSFSCLPAFALRKISLSKGFKFGVHESLRNPCYAGLWTLWSYMHNVIHSFLNFSENLSPRFQCGFSVYRLAMILFVLPSLEDTFYPPYYDPALKWRLFLLLNEELHIILAFLTDSSSPNTLNTIYGCLLNISKFFVNLKCEECRIRNPLWMKLQWGARICCIWCQSFRGHISKAAEIDPGMWFYQDGLGLS